MVFDVEWTEISVQQLESLDLFTMQRIVRKVKFFSQNATLRNIKRVKGEDCFRIRVGDYRVLFEKVSEDKIRILKVGHRKNVYER